VNAPDPLTDGPPVRARRLLVAAPGLLDPNFHRTVVLMLEHGEEGALGLVLNRPGGLRARDALPEPLASAVPPDDVVHAGGPVQPEAVILLADFAVPAAPGAALVGDVGIVDPRDAGDDLADRVRTARAFGGYAGWGAGQLEGEIAEGAWIDAEPVPEDVFTDDPAGLWRRVLDRRGGRYRLIARMPDDPSLN
jgi:putative transcriptional regulator